MRFLSLLAVAIVPSVALVAGRAQADELPIEWSAPSPCADATQMTSAVRDRLGDSPVELTDLRVRGHAERSGDEWVATLVLRDAEGAEMGERRVHSAASDCRALDGSVALVIGMMLRQHLTKADFFAPRPPPEAAPPPSPAPFAVPTAPVHRERSLASKNEAQPQSAGARVSWTSVASFALSDGVMPALGMGGAVRFDNRIGNVIGFALEVDGQGAATIRPFFDSAGTLSFSMLEVALVAHAAVLRTEALELGPELAVRGGVIWAKGTSFDAYNQTDASATAAACAGVLASLRVVSHLRFELLLEAAIPLVHDEYTVTHGAETATFANASIAGRLEGGLAWRLE